MNPTDVSRALSGDKNLQGSDLQGANLQGSDLRFAKLQGACMQGACMKGADLRFACLQGANLQGSDLRFAKLQGANLQGACMKGADLRFACLQGSDLQGANLQEANMYGANLQGSDLRGATLPDSLSVVPAEGAFSAWKQTTAGIVELLIPADALRSNATTRKCRASHAIVVSAPPRARSLFGRELMYITGETVRCDSWEPDRWVECGGGIHFFMTKEEAEAYVY